MSDSAAAVLLEPTPEGDAARRPRWGLRIALTTIVVAALGCLAAMAVAASHGSQDARDRHEVLVGSVALAQTDASVDQLTRAGALGTHADLAALGSSQDEQVLTRTDVLAFEPGEIVTRIQVESDGQSTTVLVRVAVSAATSSSASCIESSTVLTPTCSRSPSLGRYAG